MVNITEVKCRKGPGFSYVSFSGRVRILVAWIACLMVGIMCLDHRDCFCFLYSNCFYGYLLRRYMYISCTTSVDIYSCTLDFGEGILCVVGAK
jgi:hypothetical protein